MRPPFLIALLCVAVAALTFSDPIRPGDPALNAERIAVGEDTLLYLFPHEDGLYVGALLRLQTYAQSAGDSSALVRVERTLGPDDEPLHVDSFAVTRTSLAPLHQSTITPDGSSHIATFDGHAFYSNAMDMILAALPLREGYVANLILTTGQPSGEQIAYVEVHERAPVATATGSECLAWRIQVTTEGGSGTYWINDDPRLLVRYVPLDESMVIARKDGCPAGA